MDVGFTVAFTSEGEDGIRAGFDPSVDEAREVHAEEGKRWVGHGVNEMADEMSCFGSELEILATEGNDTNVVFRAGECGDAVAEKPGAVDEVAAFEVTGGCFKDPAAEVVVDGENASAGLEGTTKALDLAHKGIANRLVIDNAFLWHAERGEAGGMGFDFAESCGVEPLEAFETVLLAARFEVAKAGDFGFVRGNDDFPADFMSDAVFAAEIRHEPNPAHGEARLQ